MNSRTKRTTTVALSMLAPNFLGFLIFTAGPVLFSIIMAFTNWDLTIHNQYTTTPIRFVGLENFRNLIFGYEQHYFIDYLKNTLYLMIGIPIGIALSLIGALLLSAPLPNVKQRGGKSLLVIISIVSIFSLLLLYSLHVAPIVLFLTLVTSILVLLAILFGQTSFRTIYYLPNLTAGVATIILWKQLYKPESGPINIMLQPMLTSFSNTVRESPAFLWHGLGGLFIIAGIGLVLWYIVNGANQLRYKDVSLQGYIMGVVCLAGIGLALYGIGNFIYGLPGFVHSFVPHTKQFAELTAPAWLSDMKWAKPAIMIMGIYTAMGSNNMLLYLAALSNVPVSLTEAASIDGASKWQTFWNVTWPQLAPTTFFISIMATIGGLQGGFEQARVMTNGGPAGSTTTLSYFLYTKGFSDFQLGYASAIAWTMFIMIFILTMINWRFGNTMVND